MMGVAISALPQPVVTSRGTYAGDAISASPRLSCLGPPAAEPLAADSSGQSMGEAAGAGMGFAWGPGTGGEVYTQREWFAKMLLGGGAGRT